MLANRDGAGIHGVDYGAGVVVTRDRSHENVLLNKGGTLGDTLNKMVANSGLFLLNSKLINTALNVNGGQAAINGRIDGRLTRIASDGNFPGTGTLSDTLVQRKISPVSASGALRVTGNYTQLPGSNFEFVTASVNPSAQPTINGHANLQGGTVRVMHEATDPKPVLGNRYAMLTAADGVTDQFSDVDYNGLSPSLEFGLAYNAIQAYLKTIRDTALADATSSHNQCAVGTASVLIDEGRHLRGAALTCAKIKFHGSDSDSADTSTTAWAQILGNGGYLSSDANAGRVNYSVQMLMLGLGHQLDDGLRLGALGTIGHNTIQQPAGAASNHVDALHIGLYLVQTWNEFGLRARISRRFASDNLMPSAHKAWATGSRQQAAGSRQQLRSGRRTIGP